MQGNETENSLPNLDKLRTHLCELPAGHVTDVAPVEGLLASCWHELVGGESGGMEGYKVRGRMEDVTWDPPKLSFAIARHGGAAMGSVYAEIQSWEVDVDRGTASGGVTGRRQVEPRNPPLHVGPIAQEIADLIIQGKQDPRLKWKSPNKVRVLVGKVIPADCPQQTLAGRRKRFWDALSAQLNDAGWERRAGSQFWVKKPS
jgi:hypothetical protein